MAVVKRAGITPKSKQRDFHSDFRTDFTFERGDLARVTNEEAIKQSLRNIFLTDETERFFSTLGAGMKSILFENISPQTEALLENKIRLAVKNYEPRVEIIEITVRGDEELNGYYVTIKVSVINNNDPVSLDFILSRVR